MSFHLNPWFWVTLAGTPELWLGIAAGAAIVYIVFRKKSDRRKKVFLEVFVISLLLVFGIVFVIKNVTQVPRICDSTNPYCEPSFSFPSGHSASIFVFFSSLMLFLKRKWWFLWTVPLVVAYSRIVLEVHTPVEVFVGSAIGIVVPVVLWKFLRKRL